MAATGLDVFDKSLQTTNVWLDEIMVDLGPDRKVAYRALRAVLHTLRDRLTVDEAAHLGAQLPLIVRGIFFDMWHPAGKPDRVRSIDEFLQRIGAALADTRPINARDAARSVFKTLGRHVTAGELEQVKSQLPSEIRSLWPDKAIAETGKAEPAYAGGKPRRKA
jgi:uncharacterized protein (DUF2267 family)